MNILIGENIKRLRKSNNITQEQLAVIFNVSTAAVCKWESGETYPDITLVPQIAYYFKVSIDELLGYDESKMEEEIINILKEYDDIPNQNKYNGKCELLNNARKKYPHDYRVAERYMFDLVGGYADNDPQLLIEHSSELLRICDEIKNCCKDIKIRLNALTLQAKIFYALGKTNEALNILNDFPTYFHSSSQRKEQLFDKRSKEYYEVLNENLKLVGELFGDKLAKSIIYDNSLTNEEKKAKINDVKDWLSKANMAFKGIKAIEDQFSGREKQFLSRVE